MKKIIAAFLVFTLITSFAGCSDSVSNTEPTAADSAAVDVYLQMAQEFLEKEDYDAAINILTKGVEATGNDTLSIKLEEVLSVQATVNSSISQSQATDSAIDESTPNDEDIDYSEYIDIWATESISLFDGGIAMDIWFEYGSMMIDVTIQGPAPDSYIDRIIIEIPPKEMTSRSITTQFTDVAEMISGTLTIAFEDNSLEIKFSDIESVDETTPIWNYCDKEITLIRNEYAFDALCPEPPVEQPDETPTYDTSKASGILAEAGLTEQEFRNVCTYINSKYYENNEYVYAAGRQYYTDYPNENTLLDNYTETWVSYQSLGTKSPYYHEYNKDDLQNSKSLDDYLNRKIYGPKGASILGKQSEEYFKAMREYPADYVNKPFLLKDFRVESIYDCTYSLNNYILYDTTVRIIDYRDDVYYPNILNKTYYDMYVIFLGTQGSDTFVFALISVEKSE